MLLLYNKNNKINIIIILNYLIIIMSSNIKFLIDSNINFNKLIDENNNTIELIFNFIRHKDWKNLIKLIKSTDIDLNIKDNSGTWLLEYAIIFNQTEVIDILLEKNIRLDITDVDSKSILYNIIKFSYTDILIKFLEKNKRNIGKNILEIKDHFQNIPLFYAIKLFNINCIKIILEYTNNFYIKNIDGENCLHLAIKSQNFEIFKLILEYLSDIKSRNNQGESYLHIIIKLKCHSMLKYFIEKNKKNVNIKDLLNYVEYRYNFTILHYIAIGSELTSIEILYKEKLLKLIDGDIQDKYGNIFYHYFITYILNLKTITTELSNSILKINKIFNEIHWNINLFNIDGNTPAHLFFSNINYFSSFNLNLLINLISESINMNIQNFIGESVFYLIVKNNYWKNIYNILIKKKIDIFIITSSLNTVFDYIEKKDYDEFLNMITHSYINQLINDNNSSKWIEYWDNRCKKIVKLSDLNDTELELIKNLNIFDDINKKKNTESKNDNICIDIIKNKLHKAIEIFIQSKNYNNLTSYPTTYKFIKLISNYPNVSISTFSGSAIDIISGLIYLKSKFYDIGKVNYITISTDIIIQKQNIIDCKNISKEFENSKKNIFNRICEINEFEILWINKKIFFPQYENTSINSILIKMYNNKIDGFRWCIVPIGIDIGSFSHANYLIIDIENMEIERFEPHGAYPPFELNYEPDLLDEIIFNYIKETGLKFKYIKPKDYEPKVGFQTIEINELKNNYIGDPNGFCALWCIWWTDMRLHNSNIPRIKLFKKLNKELINGKYSYKKLIRDYSQYIVDIRDKFLMKANTNINEWLNDTIKEKNIQILDSVISSAIKF